MCACKGPGRRPEPQRIRGYSSVGRARRSQCRGRGFESLYLHQPAPVAQRTERRRPKSRVGGSSPSRGTNLQTPDLQVGDNAMPKISRGSLREVQEALARYTIEVEESALAQASKDTYLLHANHFVRWLDDDFTPGETLKPDHYHVHFRVPEGGERVAPKRYRSLRSAMQTAKGFEAVPIAFDGIQRADFTTHLEGSVCF